MTQRTSLLLGMTSLLPLLCTTAVVWQWAHLWTLSTGAVAATFGLVLLGGLVSLVLTAYFVWDVVQAPDLAHAHRTIWVIVLLAATAVALPAYWWQRLRPSFDAPAALA
jgi:hypothetical protein